MIMIINQNIAVDQNSVTIMLIFKDLEEFHTVPIVQEDVLSFVSSAGNVV